MGIRAARNLRDSHTLAFHRCPHLKSRNRSVLALVFDLHMRIEDELGFVKLHGESVPRCLSGSKGYDGPNFVDLPHVLAKVRTLPGTYFRMGTTCSSRPASAPAFSRCAFASRRRL